MLTVFPEALQRALLGNVLTVVACVLGDFATGISGQVLGHRISVRVDPLPDDDALNWVRANAGSAAMATGQRGKEFENAVQHLAAQIDRDLKLLRHGYERWIRRQLATLIARLVLTLVDDVLGAVKFDLWTQGGGPRILAGIEYRPENFGNEEEEEVEEQVEEEDEKERVFPEEVAEPPRRAGDRKESGTGTDRFDTANSSSKQQGPTN